MKQTYKAMQVSRPGQLECVEKELPVPGPGEVLIKVEACGICGADSGVVEGLEKSVEYPRVPGHEVVGTICKTSGPLPAWLKPGQRVGVGRQGGHCNACEQCRLGHFNLCQNQPVTGSTRDGGYAEYMLARETGLVAIPDDLSSVDAAPLLCAGVATFNALKKSQAQAGDTVVIQGIGGLGHLALQYARKMGFRVIAVGRGDDIAREVIALGAHYYIDTNKEEAVEVIKAFGGAKVILSTITDSHAVATLLPALLPQGRLMVVGVGKAPLSFTPGLMVGRELQINGAMTGTAIELEKTLNFSLLVAVRAQIETRSLAQAQEAYEKMRSGKASFRMVLTMGHR
ncbi:TPA: alcohol dehydrogenase catalytic domain-containing protein [Klebsiella pneumoniae]|uniref:alcohol dehydrogenase catalytic domain-containing protein n=1 Tax=Klebsiella pneumoniae TaxID=573 RepID=UPI001B30C14F|nr:alcohol dehydrogenase catalytic domain-containing protein [Klebsiella pneumoniae]MBP3099219.1 alcohol dehydrogenase catalytic domain-containing protein [Klebsiella pneumoniae]HDK6795411.1 alcohol dehydrogenase catalytic domain-containing protein [Klebsiella pneumoniae]